MIRSYLKGRQQNWDKHLGCLAGAYRSTVHESTGFSPNLLMLGREVLQPLELIYGSLRAENTNYGEYVTQLQNNLTNAHEAARWHLKQSIECYKRNYDLNISKNTYTVGQIVWYLNEQQKRENVQSYNKFGKVLVSSHKNTRPCRHGPCLPNAVEQNRKKLRLCIMTNWSHTMVKTRYLGSCKF